MNEVTKTIPLPVQDDLNRIESFYSQWGTDPSKWGTVALAEFADDVVSAVQDLSKDGYGKSDLFRDLDKYHCFGLNSDTLFQACEKFQKTQNYQDLVTDLENFNSVFGSDFLPDAIQQFLNPSH